MKGTIIPYYSKEALEALKDENAHLIINGREFAPVMQGHWIDKYGDGDWHCSCCGAIVENHEQDYRNWCFCYHCGAKMDGDKNG